MSDPNDPGAASGSPGRPSVPPRESAGGPAGGTPPAGGAAEHHPASSSGTGGAGHPPAPGAPPPAGPTQHAGGAASGTPSPAGTQQADPVRHSQGEASGTPSPGGAHHPDPSQHAGGAASGAHSPGGTRRADPPPHTHGGVSGTPSQSGTHLPGPPQHTHGAASGAHSPGGTDRADPPRHAHGEVSGTPSHGGAHLPDPPQHLARPVSVHIESMPVPGLQGMAPAAVHLHRAGTVDHPSLSLWAAIVQHSQSVSFNAFETWVNRVLCSGGPDVATDEPFDLVVAKLRDRLKEPSIRPYELLMRAADLFLLTQAGVWTIHEKKKGGPAHARLDVHPQLPGGQVVRADALPSREMLRPEMQRISYHELNSRLHAYLGSDSNNYLDAVIRANFDDGDVHVSPFSASYLDPAGPYLLELIWSYWMEQSMLVQGFNAIVLRFQNVRRAETDPLADLELDPLRPLNSFLWDWIQHEYRHLSVARRAYEYTHQYGLALTGRAVGQLRPVDPRTTFLAAFHNLLRMCWAFYKEDSDTTYIADAFPMLNALKDMSLILSQGADNQFRDLPWQARQEMLVQQWMLARPELKEFLAGKPMVAYPESWMSRMDAMRRLQKWGDVSVLHFNDLTRFGERILLSIRYGNWLAHSDQEIARTWARFWRPEVQGYLYAYQAVTGVDLSDDPPDLRSGDLRYVQPALLLEQRQQAGLSLPAPRVPEVV